MLAFPLGLSLIDLSPIERFHEKHCVNATECDAPKLEIELSPATIPGIRYETIVVIAGQL